MEYKRLLASLSSSLQTFVLVGWLAGWLICLHSTQQAGRHTYREEREFLVGKGKPSSDSFFTVTTNFIYILYYIYCMFEVFKAKVSVVLFKKKTQRTKIFSSTPWSFQALVKRFRDILLINV